jgi:hypothetical protein
VRRGVDHLHRIEVFHVDVDLAGLGVDLRGLGLAFERDGRHDLAGRRVDHAGRLAAPVHRVDLFFLPVVDDRVGVLTGGDLLQQLQRLQIDDAHVVTAAVARESLAELGTAMKPWTPGVSGMSPTTLLVCVSITTMRRVTHIQPMRGRIDREVVPAALAADRDDGARMIRTLLGLQARHYRQRQNHRYR